MVAQYPNASCWSSYDPAIYLLAQNGSQSDGSGHIAIVTSEWQLDLLTISSSHVALVVHEHSPDLKIALGGVQIFSD